MTYTYGEEEFFNDDKEESVACDVNNFKQIGGGGGVREFGVNTIEHLKFV